jgi:hypothetical protein
MDRYERSRPRPPRGFIAVLATMPELKKVAHRGIWLNPRRWRRLSIGPSPAEGQLVFKGLREDVW